MTQVSAETSEGRVTDLHLAVLWATSQEKVVPGQASFRVAISLVSEGAKSGDLFGAEAGDAIKALDGAVRQMLKHFRLPVNECPAIERTVLFDINGEGRRVFIMTASSNGFSQRTFEGVGKTELSAAMVALSRMYAFFLQGLSLTVPV